MRPLNGLFPIENHPELLVGLDRPDDSAVYQVSSDRAIISTMDFFPPVVDDAYPFGAIAAANALSDVYAMGGTPLMAINLAAFPDGLDMGILSEILQGGAEKVHESGAVIAGGHTVADKEPKYGLAVTGEIHPEKIIRKEGARPGDMLVLTKPLGTGTITTALKRGQAKTTHIEAVIEGMSRLNRYVSEQAQFYNDQTKNRDAVNAMTDITGYSLIGHAQEIARLSDVDLNIQFSQLTWYPGALAYGKADIFPGGMHRNRAYFKQWVMLDTQLEDWQEYLLYDPQTSGGLLMCVHPDIAPDLLSDLTNAGEEAAIIGSVTAGSGNICILD